MTVGLYFDHNVSRAAARELRHRGVDVITALDDQGNRLADESLLSRASALGRVFVTHDHDLLTIAARWQQEGVSFAGVLFARQGHLSVGALIDDLELAAGASSPEDMQDRVEYLPLR